MNLQMLESFTESTLKQMIINLHAENKKLKDEENKAVEEIQKEHHKEILEKVREIFELEHQVQDLTIRLKFCKERLEKKISFTQSQVTHWMEQNCLEADNVLSKDGVTEIAPTDYETLYNDYVEWCKEEEVLQMDKKTFKTEILDWQKNSKYGLCIGKSKKDSEGMIHGYLRSPLINLKII